jgi:hypothetical protein
LFVLDVTLLIGSILKLKFAILSTNAVMVVIIILALTNVSLALPLVLYAIMTKPIPKITMCHVLNVMEKVF